MKKICFWNEKIRGNNFLVAKIEKVFVEALDERCICKAADKISEVVN